MILDDLMAWIILQVRGENATAASTMQTLPRPASSQSLIAKGRRQTLLPPLPFCWVQRKGPRKWRRPPAIWGYYAGGNAARRAAALSLLVSLSQQRAQSNCVYTVRHVEPQSFHGIPASV